MSDWWGRRGEAATSWVEVDTRVSHYYIKREAFIFWVIYSINGSNYFASESRLKR